MTNNLSKQTRVFGVYLSSRGFGFAVMEGSNQLVDFGNKVITDKKNAHSLTSVEKLIRQYQPDLLALQDVDAKGARRATRIKKLHHQVVGLAKRNKLKTTEISVAQVCYTLLGLQNRTKYEIAKHLADKFPDELMPRMPTKRKAWTSEDARMDVFSAVALSATSQLH